MNPTAESNKKNNLKQIQEKRWLYLQKVGSLEDLNILEWV